jgi:5-methylcytosine-specific restriction endonuclease McrA
MSASEAGDVWPSGGARVCSKKKWLTTRASVLSENPLVCGERIAEEVDHIVPLNKGGTHTRGAI